MKRKVIKCTVPSFIGKIVEFELTDRHVNVEGAKFAIITATANFIFSYNCIFLLGDV